MKYIVIVPDGMADYPMPELENRTPLEAARTPNFDMIAKFGILGRVKTIPPSLKPASDVANLSILGYNPQTYYTGRGPLEAANLGVELGQDDVAFRCNLVTANSDTLTDYSAGHIRSQEAAQIIKFIDSKLGSENIKFFPGVSYRHLMLVKNAAGEDLEKIECKPAHDITGASISKNLPKGKNSELLIDLMQKSREILSTHEINSVRIDLKENPANMIWLWGQGKKPNLPSFYEKYGVKGSVISAVDLIKGLGKILGLEVINVPGATGYYDTDYEAKARAAVRALEHRDFVFVHIEAPDEAGHNGDLREKITAIERCDQLVLGTILKSMEKKRNFRVMVMPDHATPISLKTHVSDTVFFGIFGKSIMGKGYLNYSEQQAQKAELFFEKGHELMEYFIKHND
ncbi:MAG: cofactor-independent phosphoglycerate mutase [Candidatus Omnitrophica bacterium]|jgi:2,3-bisphosphoglycerate-independent phosphoglycerate mutase|nr:cofactor-independent phosphoglycerate mutase [Candidatus Omnitrophota bacterium]